MKKRKFLKTVLIISLLLGSNTWIMAQKTIVSGTVKDHTGEALVGVSILVEGTTTGTVTDFDGAYSMDVPGSSSVLKFSYIGYVTQSVAVGNRTVIDVVLQEDMQSLEEVVVVGFGTQKKVNLTGAVGVATAREIENRPVQLASQVLQGLVPGL
ncbi:MAG: carboxypeptidase-like regulatory domain-containing protein, partial [Tannerella sp.]|nr:carboxypeptidase-like regulatory domain-containing protein [Tannerella sp.]